MSSKTQTRKKFAGLTTSRLRLRDFTVADLKTFTAYRNDPKVARYQSWQSYDIDSAEAFFMLQRVLAFGQPNSWYQIAITDLNTDLILGDCVIHFGAGNCDKTVEIGFTLATEHQGHGYAVEAIEALLAFLFNQLKLRRVIAVTDVLNSASIRLLEGLGFRREAHFVENLFYKGSWGSEYAYGLLQREYVERDLK
ncbi:MAG: RimJ/RimL family protein N-acetyltransferase [Phenylobacterium sp.]|jgi:RimJ/RimL family protein N-acetyltransferase